ncbi:unnamed protein product [Lactuca saligna]|uniref:Reverse transcriptase zinc-binding domain-containing protein n=1 Tax=Lactuca saligna TaxID=75948 RepID=A0AA35YKG7_LACSI|nr:unnamed protein product [Lactuca saligna]
MVPIKVNFFVWRALQGRIPSAIALSHKGFKLDSTLCGSCIGGSECVNHIIVGFPFDILVREKLFRWCRIDPFEAHEEVDIVDFATSCFEVLLIKFFAVSKRNVMTHERPDFFFLPLHQIEKASGDREGIVAGLNMFVSSSLLHGYYWCCSHGGGSS